MSGVTTEIEKRRTENIIPKRTTSSVRANTKVSEFSFKN